MSDYTQVTQRMWNNKCREAVLLRDALVDARPFIAELVPKLSTKGTAIDRLKRLDDALAFQPMPRTIAAHGGQS